MMFPYLVLAGVVLAMQSEASPSAPARLEQVPQAATFSAIACDTVAGEWGVAVASRFLAVGAVVPWAKAEIGAIATQARANPSFGPRGLELLERGAAAGPALRELLATDPDRELRQVAVVDAEGAGAAYTGERCLAWAGHRLGQGYVVLGNSLAGEHVLDAMADAFERAGDRPLAERLLVALQAGDGAGGDSRGKQAAALVVVKARGGYEGWNDRYVDFRVDDAPDPVEELARLYALHARTLLPLVDARLGDEALAANDRERAEREFARVIGGYRDAIEGAPDDPAPRNGLAWFFARRRINLDEAQALAEEALRMAPESWQVLDTLAEISYARGRFQEAEEFAQRAVDLNPESLYLKQQLARFQEARSTEEGDS